MHQNPCKLRDLVHFFFFQNLLHILLTLRGKQCCLKLFEGEEKMMKKTASLFMLVTSISMILCFSAFADSHEHGADMAVNVAQDNNGTVGHDANRNMGMN